MERDLSGAAEVCPGWHLGKLDPGVLPGGEVGVCYKTIVVMQFGMHSGNYLFLLVVEFLFLLLDLPLELPLDFPPCFLAFPPCFLGLFPLEALSLPVEEPLGLLLLLLLDWLLSLVFLPPWADFFLREAPAFCRPL